MPGPGCDVDMTDRLVDVGRKALSDGQIGTAALLYIELVRRGHDEAALTELTHAVDRLSVAERTATAAMILDADPDPGLPSAFSLRARALLRWSQRAEAASLAAEQFPDLDAADDDTLIGLLEFAAELSSLELATRTLQRVDQRLDKPSKVQARRIARARHRVGRAVRLASLEEDGFQVPARTTRGSTSVSSGSPTRVLMCLHNSLPEATGGYATRAHGLLTALGSRVDVTALTRHGFPADQLGTSPVTVTGRPRPHLIDGIHYRRSISAGEGYRDLPRLPYMQRNAQAIETHARELEADLIHAASFYTTGLPAIRAARSLGVPSVYEVRGLPHLTFLSRRPEYAGSIEHRTDVRFELQACREADAVLTLTEAMRGELVALGVDPAKITLAPNSVDVSRFQPSTGDHELAAELGAEGKVVIGYAGSFVDYEGLDDLVTAFTKLRARHGQDVLLLLIGDGAEYPRIKKQVMAAGLEAQVKMPGRLAHHEVARYYSVIDVVALPRKPLRVCEVVSPMKPFEAMAMAKPLVVSSVEALAEIVIPDRTGIVFRKGNVDSLTDALAALVEDPDRRRRLGQEARLWVEANRSWEKLATDVTRVYSDVL
jgi:glycosyltransferase involved in cell wall biosynthesis